MPRPPRRLPGLFAGVLTLGFTPDYESPKPFCRGAGQHFVSRADGKGLTLLPDPKLALHWVDVHGAIDSVCPAPAAAAFIRTIQNAQISLVPGVEHDFADPHQWSAQVRAALESRECRLAGGAGRRAARLEGSAPGGGARDRYRQ